MARFFRIVIFTLLMAAIVFFGFRALLSTNSPQTGDFEAQMDDINKDSSDNNDSNDDKDSSDKESVSENNSKTKKSE